MWFYEGVRKAVGRSSFKHLIDFNHCTDPQVDFNVVHTILTNLHRFIRTQLIKTAKALTIHELKPELYVQKEIILILALNWRVLTNTLQSTNP